MKQKEKLEVKQIEYGHSVPKNKSYSEKYIYSFQENCMNEIFMQGKGRESPCRVLTKEKQRKEKNKGKSL